MRYIMHSDQARSRACRNSAAESYRSPYWRKFFQHGSEVREISRQPGPGRYQPQFVNNAPQSDLVQMIFQNLMCAGRNGMVNADCESLSGNPGLRWRIVPTASTFTTTIGRPPCEPCRT